MQQRRPFSLLRYLAVAATCGLALLGAQPARAATLSLRASATSVSVGQTFTVRLLVNTQGKAINNAEATISYPRDLLEAVSASRGGSIFRLWIVEPTIGNGTISLNGGVPNPGYTGAGGELASVTFRARRAGTATLGIGGAAVRENDGLGTDILSGSAGVTVTIADREQPERAESASEAQAQELVAGAVAVSSPTHPDQGSWYSARKLVVRWVAPPGTRAVQVALDESPSGAPTRTLPASVSEREYADLTDGIWYFHIRTQTAQGWTRVTTFAARIDGTPPKDLSIAATTGAGSEGDGPANAYGAGIASGEPAGRVAGIRASGDVGGYPALQLSANDETSGVQYYEVRIDGGSSLHVPAELAKLPVAVPSLTPGQHLVTVAAYDNAGNRVEAQKVVLIMPTVAPKITYAVTDVRLGGRVAVSGWTVYPLSTITVTLRSPSGRELSYDVQSDADGNFSFRSDPVQEAGRYEARVYVSVAVRGPAAEVSFQVSRGGLAAWLRQPTAYLLGLLVLALAYSVWNWLRFLRLRQLRRSGSAVPVSRSPRRR